MKRIALTVAALGAALSPAALGLWGNASFSQAVPVDVPLRAQVVTVPATPSSSQTPRPARHTSAASSPASSTRAVADDHGGDVPREQRTEAGDDRGSQGRTAPAVPRTRPQAPAPVRTTETGGDHGGDVPRDQRTEAGDDRDRPAAATKDDSSTSGRDSHGDGSGSHEGSDDRGSDDGGSGGHGSDDAGSDDQGHHGSDD